MHIPHSAAYLQTDWQILTDHERDLPAAEVIAMRMMEVYIFPVACMLALWCHLTASLMHDHMLSYTARVQGAYRDDGCLDAYEVPKLLKLQYTD